ncbi:MAG TPA: hypothetical protein VMB50_02890 [Myxococcales bacterium]|nr:hypothetical protein [Myxococcales bacterium]
MATNTKSTTADATKAQNLINGAQQSLLATSKLTILGVAMLVSAIITKIQGYLTLDQNVSQTLAAYRAAVAARKAAAPDRKQFIAGFIATLKAQFGPANPVLQTFGIAPPKARKQLTAEEKATAAALGKQTKSVRGPTGKVQRGKVTVQGAPGMVLVTATGQPVPGVTQGPTAPAVPAPNGSSTPAVSAPAVPAPASSNGTGGSNGSGSNGSAQ